MSSRDVLTPADVRLIAHAEERRRSIAWTPSTALDQLARRTVTDPVSALALLAARPDVFFTRDQMRRRRVHRLVARWAPVSLALAIGAATFLLLSRHEYLWARGFAGAVVVPALVALMAGGWASATKPAQRLAVWLAARDAAWQERENSARRAASVPPVDYRPPRGPGGVLVIVCAVWVVAAAQSWPQEEERRVLTLLRDGLALAQQGDLAAARAQYQLVADRYPHHAVGRVHLASIARGERRLDDAGTLLADAALIEPAHPALHRELARYYRARGWPVSERLAADRAEQLRPAAGWIIDPPRRPAPIPLPFAERLWTSPPSDPALLTEAGAVVLKHVASHMAATEQHDRRLAELLRRGTGARVLRPAVEQALASSSAIVDSLNLALGTLSVTPLPEAAPLVLAMREYSALWSALLSQVICEVERAPCAGDDNRAGRLIADQARDARITYQDARDGFSLVIQASPAADPR